MAVPHLPTEGRAGLLPAYAGGAAIGTLGGLIGLGGAEFRLPLLLLSGFAALPAVIVNKAISLPTMLVGLARHGQDNSFAVLRRHRRFVLAMTAGSVAGAAVGGLLLGVVPAAVLLPMLVAVLLVSALKVWRHASGSGDNEATKRAGGRR